MESTSLLGVVIFAGMLIQIKAWVHRGAFDGVSWQCVITEIQARAIARAKKH